jgi:hypothetical protein
MQTKIWLILIAIAFILGVLLSSGTAYYLYSKSSRKYADDIAKANDINKQLKSQFDKSEEINRQLSNFNSQLAKGNIDGQKLNQTIADLNRQLGDRLKQGSVQK